MKIQNIEINSIPAIIWGEQSDKVYIHVHGKQSRKEYAENFAEIAEKKGYQTLSFDLPEHGERTDSSYRCDVWNGMHDLSLIADYAFSKWNDVSLFACSLGAYFSLNTYADRGFTKCLFQSPVLDMEYLVRQMFIWFHVTEERLRVEKEISTPVDLLRWDYFQYILEYPIENWNFPTSILYGGKDNMQSYKVVKDFVDAHHCKLTVSENSEHPFMQPEDMAIVTAWLEDNI
ncbi:MAG: alpha/beta hydrolase [Angelakisella sp.]